MHLTYDSKWKVLSNPWNLRSVCITKKIEHTDKPRAVETNDEPKTHPAQPQAVESNDEGSREPGPEGDKEKPP